MHSVGRVWIWRHIWLWIHIRGAGIAECAVMTQGAGRLPRGRGGARLAALEEPFRTGEAAQPFPPTNDLGQPEGCQTCTPALIEGGAARPQPPRLTLRTEPPEVGEGRFGPRTSHR